MQSGKILVIDTPENIKHSYKNTLWSVKSSDMFKSLIDVRTFPDTLSCFSFGDMHHLSLKDNSVTKEAILNFLKEKGHTDLDVQPIQPNIEDCFMELMSKPATNNLSSNA